MQPGDLRAAPSRSASPGTTLFAAKCRCKSGAELVSIVATVVAAATVGKARAELGDGSLTLS
jgi:hypothetical protein